MAPFLRAGSHGLRYVLRVQRENGLLKLPELKHVRRYSEPATLEDSSPAANDVAGESGASSTGADSLKGQDDANSFKETLATDSAKPDNGPKESPADKLTNLILAKMRAKNNSNDTAPSPTGSSSSKVVNKPMDKSSESGRGDKWEQVMESMRNMAFKRREQLATRNASAKPGSPKRQGIEDQDDFSDLDCASGQLSKAFNNLPSADEAFQVSSESSKQRESSLQSSNVKQKSRESKTVNFSFLKALENNPPTARPQSARSGLDGNINTVASSKPKDIGFQPPSKDAKPLSFEFLKPSDAKTELSSANESKGSFQLGVQPKPNDAARTFSQNQSNQKRESGLLPGAAGAHARQLSLEESKHEMNNTLPGRPSGLMVAVHNVSGQSNLALIKEALSIHGEVITCFKKPNLDGSYSAFVEFKAAEAMEDALAAKWLQIDSKSFSITRADAPITTVVRLRRVSAVADNQVSAMCEKFGQIDHVRKRGAGVYDVFYKTGELTNMSSILDRLNEVTFKQRRWVALPAPLLHPVAKKDVLKSSEGQAWHAQQMSQTLGRLEMGLEAMSLYFEDLKALISMEDELTK